MISFISAEDVRCTIREGYGDTILIEASIDISTIGTMYQHTCVPIRHGWITRLFDRGSLEERICTVKTNLRNYVANETNRRIAMRNNIEFLRTKTENC